MRTPLSIFFADRGDAAVSKSHCDKTAQPDGLTSLAIRSNERRKSREQAHLENAGNLIADIGDFIRRSRDRRTSQSLHRAHLAIYTDRSAYKIAKCVAGLTDAEFKNFVNREISIKWYGLS